MKIIYEEGRLYNVDSDNNKQLLTKYTKVYDKTEGLFCVGIGADPLTGFGGKYGYIDDCGNILIEPVFDYARPFHEGLALVSIGRDKNGFNGKDGFIDNTGIFVIEPQYSYARDFWDGISVVGIGGNKYGKGTKYGLINNKGSYIIEPQYTFIGAFVDGCAWVQEGTEYGFINKKGQKLTSLAFSNVGDFREGVAYVKEKEKNGLYGYIDATGQYVIEPKFEKASYFIDGLAIVKSNKKNGIIDKTGKFVVEPIYDEISEWNSFYYVDGTLNKEDDRYSVLNHNAKIKTNWAIIRKGNKYGIIDKDLKIVFEPQFYRIEQEINDGMIKVLEVYKSKFNTVGYYIGFISEDGKTLIPPMFINAENFKNGRAKVQIYAENEYKYGYIDKEGNWIE